MGNNWRRHLRRILFWRGFSWSLQPRRLGGRWLNRHRNRTLFCSMRDDAAKSRRTIRLRYTRLGAGLLVGIGALISVAGSDESEMIGTAKLGYALAADGLFPKIFAKIHTKFKTPYASVIIQSVTALAAALLAPLFGGLGLLISVSVFFLAIAYLAASAAVFPLRKKNPVPNAVYRKRSMVIPVPGIVFSVYLITQCGLSQIAIGIVLLAVGIPIYIKYSPKKELAEAKQALISEQNIFRRIYREEHVFLAHVIFHFGDYYRRFMRKPEKKHP